MTLEEYNSRIDGVIKDIQGGAHAQIMTELALDAIAMIKDRVIQSGYNAKGVQFSSITTNTKKPHTDYTKPYKAMKKKAGKYRGFVDFSFSTRMWANIKLVSSDTQLKKGIAKISCTTTHEQDKLNWNTEQRGPILELSDFERDILVEEYDEKILNIWRKNGL